LGKVLKILVIDDDRAIIQSCQRVLKRDGHELESADNGTVGLNLFAGSAYDLVLLDLRMPDIDGMSLLRQIREQDPRTEVLIMSGHGTVEAAVKAVKLGAFDFLSKPFTSSELRRAVDKAREHLDHELERTYLREEMKRNLPGDIVFGSDVMDRVLETLTRVAATDTTVLLTGESGTGKGLMARRVHEISRRNKYPFVAVDCSTLVPTLFESELFGHVKGAYTGADSDQIGKFELSSGGTLFFDEVSNISLDIQAKLLKAVEERAIYKVGSNRLIRVDTRLVAATNKDLAEAVKLGNFREDLFYRLNVMPVQLPALRERPEDIPLLCEHFLDRFRRLATVGLRGFSDGALKLLSSHVWPGNVRELENVVQRLVILATGPIIGQDEVLTAIPGLSEPQQTGIKSLSELEKRHIAKTLQRLNGHRTQTAKALGIDRKTLLHKIKRYDLA
jgi:two-component system response regulator HydG